jgi:hypothetical protein
MVSKLTKKAGIFKKIELFVPAKPDHDPDPDWFF